MTISSLHISDMLDEPSIYYYADDSTVDAVYSSRVGLPRENVDQCRNELVSPVEPSLGMWMLIYEVKRTWFNLFPL